MNNSDSTSRSVNTGSSHNIPDTMMDKEEITGNGLSSIGNYEHDAKDQREYSETEQFVEFSNSTTQVASMMGDMCSDSSAVDENLVNIVGDKENPQLEGNNDECRRNTYDGTEVLNSAETKDDKGGSEEERKYEDKHLKTLELAMVELHPLPKPIAENVSAPQETVVEISGGSDHTEIAATNELPIENQVNDSKVERHTDVASNERHSPDELTDEATVSPDQSTGVTCQPQILIPGAKNPTNTNGDSQWSGTIVSDMGSEKDPINCPRPTGGVKPGEVERINSATVTTSQLSPSVSAVEDEKNVKKVPTEPANSSSKTDSHINHNNKSKGSVSHRPKLSTMLLSNIEVEQMNVESNGHPAQPRSIESRPSTRDKCRPGQRVLTKTGRSGRVNHYQNSPMPATAGAGQKCFPLNNVNNKDYRETTLDITTTVPNYERPYGKRELRRALPRKSNFNCHDAAMKEAGFEDESIAQRKAERLKERLARVANSLNPLLGMSNYVSTGCVEAEVQVVVTDESNKPGAQAEADERDIEAVAAGNLPNILLGPPSHSEVLSGESPESDIKDEAGPQRHLLGGPVGGTASGGEISGGSRRRRPGSARIEYIECKPLSQYLEYIRDNQHEYFNFVRHQQQQQQAARKDKAVATLIKMGQAFELRHQGGIARSRKSLATIAGKHDSHATGEGEGGTDVIVMAAKALRPRTADVGKFAKSRDRSGGVRRGADTSGRPLSEDRRSSHQEKGTPSTNATGSTGAGASHGTKEEEHPRTELEKRKLRAEDWTRSVPTHTLTRARIQSLRELGADDAELTKWWEALKGCHYLRQNICQI